jgi:arylsulfatase A-like enzyme
VTYLRDLSTAETRHRDDELARLWEMLDASGWLTNSLVLFMADHGDGFWEHLNLLHGNSLYRDVATVPAFLMAPGLETGTWTGATTHKDLAPTLLAMPGLDVPAEVTGEGIGQTPESRVRLSLQVGQIVQPRIIGDSRGKNLQDAWPGERALYDVTTDPDETQNMYDDHPEEVAAIWEVLEDAFLSVSAWPDGTVPVDPGP